MSYDFQTEEEGLRRYGQPDQVQRSLDPTSQTLEYVKGKPRWITIFTRNAGNVIGANQHWNFSNADDVLGVFFPLGSNPNSPPEGYEWELLSVWVFENNHVDAADQIYLWMRVAYSEYSNQLIPIHVGSMITSVHGGATGPNYFHYPTTQQSAIESWPSIGSGGSWFAHDVLKRGDHYWYIEINTSATAGNRLFDLVYYVKERKVERT